MTFNWPHSTIAAPDNLALPEVSGELHNLMTGSMLVSNELGTFILLLPVQENNISEDSIQAVRAQLHLQEKARVPNEEQINFLKEWLTQADPQSQAVEIINNPTDEVIPEVTSRVDAIHKLEVPEIKLPAQSVQSEGHKELSAIEKLRQKLQGGMSATN